MIYSIRNLVIFVVLLFCYSSATLSVTLREFIQAKPCRHEQNFVESSQVRPTSFWRHAFCKEPLVVRSTAATWPALAKWTDQYLVESANASHSRCNIEVGKKERRNEQEALSLSMAEFINKYQTADWYFVDKLPDYLVKSGDLEVPWFLKAGCPTSNLSLADFPTITMWISSGGTKSHFHFDDMENVICVLDGSKSVLLLNPIDGRESVDINSTGLHSLMDVDDVDSIRYSSLSSKPFLEATLQKGDCIYIPFHWLHQVNSFDRSMALSFWFYPYNLNVDECYPLFDQLSPVVQNSTKSIAKLVKILIPDPSNNAAKPLTENQFTEAVVPEILPHDWSPPREDIEKLSNHVRLFFRQLVDIDHDDLASRDELNRLSHSGITWLFHLTRQMFDVEYDAKCSETLDISSKFAHEEL